MPEWLQLFTLARFGRPLLLFTALFAGLWISARLVRLRFDAGTVAARALRIFVLVISATACIAFIWIAGWYTADKRYYDFAEPTMPSVAWMFESGKVLYPPSDAAEQYAHIYGPMAFIPLAVAMRVFGTDLSVTKSVGSGAGIVALLVLFAILRSRVGTRVAVIFAGQCAILLLVFRNAAFWSRPDSLELLCVSIGLWAALWRSRAGWIVLGVSAGLLWNLKFSGPLYSLPLFVLLLERSGRQRAVLAAAIAAIVLVLPFVLFRSVSFHDYRTWILLSAKNGIDWSTLRQNVEWAVYALAPLGVAMRLSVRQRPLTVLSPAVAISLVVAVCSIAVLAAKPGSGPYHLLPFFPVIVFLTAVQIHQLQVDHLHNSVPLAALAFTGVTTLIALAQQASFITTVRQIDAIGPIADITRFSDNHADGMIQMGYSSDERMTFVRPLLVFRSGMYLLDQPAIQEHQLAGFDLPPATLEAVRSCAVAYWLIPKHGEPFSAINRYPMTQGRPLFGNAFRQAFFDSYQRSESTEYFDVWVCAKAKRR
jgi:hypothetical protein